MGFDPSFLAYGRPRSAGVPFFRLTKSFLAGGASIRFVAEPPAAVVFVSLPLPPFGRALFGSAALLKAPLVFARRESSSRAVLDCWSLSTPPMAALSLFWAWYSRLTADVGPVEAIFSAASRMLSGSPYCKSSMHPWQQLFCVLHVLQITVLCLLPRARPLRQEKTVKGRVHYARKTR